MNNNIDTDIQDVKNIYSKYRQAKRYKVAIKKKPVRHAANNSCPVFKTVFDYFPDMEIKARWAMADSFCKQAHKYKIVGAEKMSLDKLMSAIKDRKSAFTYPTTKERAVPGFQDNSTRSTDDSLKSVKDKVLNPSNYQTEQECIQNYIDAGYSPNGARTVCSNFFNNPPDSKGGQSKQASLEPQQAPAWMLTSWNSDIRDKALEFESRQQESLLRNASAITEIPAWAATNMSAGELAQAQEELDRHNNNQSRLRSASVKDQEAHARRMRLIHEPFHETMNRRADNRMRQANVEEDKSDSDIPAWAVCAGYGLE